MIKLTQRQQEILDFIRNTLEVLTHRRRGRKSPMPSALLRIMRPKSTSRRWPKKASSFLSRVRRAGFVWSSNWDCR